MTDSKSSGTPDSGEPPALPLLPPRSADSHKGDFGRALLVGGSRGMSGAIALAGRATLRSGAGLVTLAVPQNVVDTVAQFEPSYMTLALPCDASGLLTVSAKDQLAVIAEKTTCFACGPGMGRSSGVTELVSWMYQVLPQPLVVDADGLAAIAESAGQIDEPAGPRILTPHLGEFRRLVEDAELPREGYEQLAVHIAKTRGIIIVLKGHRTMITDGQQTAFNQTGNPGMATGGSGDVLTGVITALVCQGLQPYAAARLGVHLHGLAGDFAAQELGQVSMIASDLIRFLPQAFLAQERD